MCDIALAVFNVNLKMRSFRDIFNYNWRYHWRWNLDLVHLEIYLTTIEDIIEDETWIWFWVTLELSVDESSCSVGTLNRDMAGSWGH